MRCRVQSWLLALAAVLALQGCSSDSGGADAGAGADAAVEECKVTAPSECSEPTVYADVQPIIEQRCVVCHDGSGENWPLTSYQHAADWNLEIRAAMLSCAMPPPGSGVTMTTEERERILMWIRCGFPE